MLAPPKTLANAISPQSNIDQLGIIWKLDCKQCLISRGTLPNTMCHPVTATGSLLVQVNLIKIVPNAIASCCKHPELPKLKATSVISVSDINHQFLEILAGLLRILFLLIQKVSLTILLDELSSQKLLC